MESYFIRHKGDFFLKKNDEFFKKHLLVIHYEDKKSIDPKDYKSSTAKMAIKCFAKLAKRGGYVWARYSFSNNNHRTLIGKIPQNSKVIFSNTYLKILKLKNVKEVKSNQYISMQNVAPMGTISLWKIIGTKLENLVKGKKFDINWSELDSTGQEIVCAEYLRYIKNRKLKIRYFLAPIGRTMKDIDVYGINSFGNEIFAQVTFSNSKSTIEEKLTTLKSYKSRNNKLIFFSPNDYGLTPKNIGFISTDKVQKWFLSQKTFRKRILGI